MNIAESQAFKILEEIREEFAPGCDTKGVWIRQGHFLVAVGIVQLPPAEFRGSQLGWSVKVELVPQWGDTDPISAEEVYPLKELLDKLRGRRWGIKDNFPLTDWWER